jgi:glycosyltransferase involved in cell wall biosynthesis
MNQKILLTLIIVIYTILMFILYKFFPKIKNNIKWFVAIGTTIVFITTICIVMFSKETYSEINHRFVYIVPSYNNKDWYKRNIDSMISQKNTNWHMIYIDDCSDDGTFDLVKEYLSDKGMIDKCTLIRQDKKYGQAYNRYLAYHLCNDEDVCILLDGDDWLIDDSVLDYLDDFMKRENVDMTYRNFKYFQNGKITNGYNIEDYSQDIIKNKRYRADKWRGGHLRVIKAKYLKNINPYDFLDLNLNMIKCCTDLVETWASLEQCNGRHKMVDKDLMIYNRDNSVRYNTSEYNKSNKEYRKIIEEKVKTIKPYLNYKKNNKKYLTVINIEHKDYKLNLSKYRHELEKHSDLLILPNSKVNMYNSIFKKYKKVFYLNDYRDYSYNLDKKNKIESNILLTVIIACYNCEKYIEETLDSLEKQTNKSFQVILINDKSTDKTEERIRLILKKYTIPIVLYNNESNLGYAHTLATGIGMCDTQYFCTLDSDDTIEGNTVEIVLKYISKYPDYGFFYTNFWYCDKNLKKIKKGFCKEIPKNQTNLQCNCISQLRIFCKKDYYNTLGYLETNEFRKGAEDKDIYFKLEEKCKLKFIDKCLYNYRYNDASMTKKKDGKKQTNNLFELARKKAIKRRKDNKIINKFYSITGILPKF